MTVFLTPLACAKLFFYLLCVTKIPAVNQKIAFWYFHWCVNQNNGKGMLYVEKKAFVLDFLNNPDLESGLH